ncbi:MAG: D-glycero-beta-D-manno-heptose-7-phosphate kinase [Bacteroidales bacterium]|nr:D-glycero-beta-D-manno-heptose-7-phosphate kinase [Bacteroidales bacterium]
MTKEGKYTQLFRDFDQQKIMIIGDVMIDSYLWGSVDRISPEAPIPIVALKKRENRMGGAANVALNVKALGSEPILCSVIGHDDKGEQFLSLLEQSSIRKDGIIRSRERVTTTKFRIFGNHHQMLRVDEEVDFDLSLTDQQELLTRIEKILAEEKVHCIIFQDYNKGVISDGLIKKVVSIANNMNIPVTVDPKQRNFTSFSGVTLFKPNLKELKEGLKMEITEDNQESVIQAAQSLRKMLNCNYVMTTLSEKGVLVSLADSITEKNIFVPAHARSVADVSGAGDTVISVASACVAAGCTPYEIAYISNLAGGLVCEEVGVVPINKEKLLKEVLTLL